MNHTQANESEMPTRYVLRDLAPADLEEFEDHLADCSVCMNDVWTATTFAANAKEAFRTIKPKPASSPWLLWVGRPFPALAFSTVLNVVLLAALGYMTLRLYPTWRAESAEMIFPGSISVVAVHGAVRDAAAPPVVKASGRLMVLSFDLPQRYPHYYFSIADSTGASILSGRIQDNGSDALNLRVPVGRLRRGDYRVTATGIKEDQSSDPIGTCLLQVTRR